MTRKLGSFYTVEPGEDEVIYFPRTLDGLTGKQGAMQTAIRMSAGGTAQQILVTEKGATRAIREYVHGKETWRSGCSLIPPPAKATPPPPEPGQLAEVRYLRPSKNRRSR